MPAKIRLSLHVEDVERLMEAFKEGKLAELGITEINGLKPADLKSLKPSENKWAGTEGKRRGVSKRDDVPPRA